MQTEVQKDNAIRIGSIVLEVGPTLETLVNVGALRDITFNATGETSEVVFDNVPAIRMFRNGDKFALNATLAEINWSVIGIMNDGQVTVETTAGTPVAGETQVLPTGAWSFDKVVELKGQNDSGLAPTINSVTGSSDGATSDFKLVQLPNGLWGVSIDAGGSLGSAVQDVTIDYDYTPSATKRITFDSAGKMIDKFMRITNTNQDGETKVYTLSGVSNVTAMEIDFAGDEENDVATLPISLEGRVIEIIDAQQTT